MNQSRYAVRQVGENDFDVVLLTTTFTIYTGRSYTTRRAAAAKAAHLNRWVERQPVRQGSL